MGKQLVWKRKKRVLKEEEREFVCLYRDEGDGRVSESALHRQRSEDVSRSETDL